MASYLVNAFRPATNVNAGAGVGQIGATSFLKVSGFNTTRSILSRSSVILRNWFPE